VTEPVACFGGSSTPASHVFFFCPSRRNDHVESHLSHLLTGVVLAGNLPPRHQEAEVPFVRIAHLE
jgi:hypothetical protein